MPDAPSECGNDFHFLAWRGNQVLALRPDSVVEQQFELKPVLSRHDQTPGFGIHTFKRRTAIPGESGALTAHKEVVAKANVDLGFDGDGSNSVSSGSFGRSSFNRCGSSQF